MNMKFVFYIISPEFSVSNAFAKFDSPCKKPTNTDIRWVTQSIPDVTTDRRFSTFFSSDWIKCVPNAIKFYFSSHLVRYSMSLWLEHGGGARDQKSLYKKLLSTATIHIPRLLSFKIVTKGTNKWQYILSKNCDEQ